MRKILLGDCLDVMDKLIEQGVTVDAIITDPPYGTTACKWDSVIPFDEMWLRLNKLIKSNGAIVLFGSEPFSSHLRLSNLKMFKYDWIWDKKIPSGMAFCRYQPMRQHELISIFSKDRTNYFPQKVQRDSPIKAGGNSQSKINNKGIEKALKKTYTDKNPISIISEMKIRQQAVHPTQKPVALMEYLIKTYTNEGETVLDFTCGSGTTGVACKNTNREFIGIELDEKYFEIAKKRLAQPTQERISHDY